jgi:hypothetical protein
MNNSNDTTYNNLDIHARHQHYQFAHVILPKVACSYPEKFLETLHSPNGQQFLLETWNNAGKNFGFEKSIDPMDLRYSIESFNDIYSAVVIELPKPERMTEAYFVALVFQKQKRLLSSIKSILAHYFTLELGVDITDKSTYTVLCEWKIDKKGSPASHMNYGDGPPPEKEAFLEALKMFLNIGNKA